MVCNSSQIEIVARFFVDKKNITDRNIYITEKDDLHHMKKVLRLRKGEHVEISDGEQWEYEAVLEEIGDVDATLRIVDKQKFAREPYTKVTLFQGVPKAGKMDYIIQKCVELGISSIVPVFMDRCDVKDNGRIEKKADRWQKIADEACKQCRRGIQPSVLSPVDDRGMLEMLSGFDLVLFPYENEEDRTIKDCLRGLNDRPETAAIVIGPEGGFSDSEADVLKQFNCVTLGRTILRTETAGMAALAMTMYELEL